MKNKLLIFALSALSAVICGCSTLIPDESYDVVVYGGTSAGVTSAVQAAKSGKKVVLIAPEGRLGAMSSSGLGMTDSGKTATIGPEARAQRQSTTNTKLCGYSSLPSLKGYLKIG